MHIAPGQWPYSPQGTKFWCQQKLLVTSIICCYFQIIDDNSFWNIHCFSFFIYKSIRDQIWPCHKIGQGQPRVIVWTNLVVLEHPMLHKKFQGHQPLGFGEEYFLRFLLYIGMAASLVKWPGPFEQTFVSLSQEISIWNLASIDPVVSEEKMFENVDIQHTYKQNLRTTEAYLYYMLTNEPKGSVELKTARKPDTAFWQWMHSDWIKMLRWK